MVLKNQIPNDTGGNEHDATVLTFSSYKHCNFAALIQNDHKIDCVKFVTNLTTNTIDWGCVALILCLASIVSG